MPYLPKELWPKGPKLSKNNLSVQSFYVAFFHIPTTRIENIDDINGAPKGQLISEQIYAALYFPKMQRKLPGFLP